MGARTAAACDAQANAAGICAAALAAWSICLDDGISYTPYEAASLSSLSLLLFASLLSCFTELRSNGMLMALLRMPSPLPTLDVSKRVFRFLHLVPDHVIFVAFLPCQADASEPFLHPHVLHIGNNYLAINKKMAKHMQKADVYLNS
jgi:hypothetical protein